MGFGTSYSWVASDATINSALYTAGYTTSGSLIVPHIEQYFAKGASSALTLTVTNLVGKSASQSLTVTRQSSPAPILLGSATQSNAITDLILLSFTPQLPGSCFSATTTIQYQWTALNNSVVLDPSTTSTSTLGFAKPYLSNGLSYGQSYTFVLSAQLAGLNASSTNRSLTLTIADKPLIVGLAGPSIFRAGAGSDLTLTTAGATQLPTQAQSVSYYWTCTTAAGVACVDLTGQYPVPSSPTQLPPLIIPADTLAVSATPYTFAVAVSVDGQPSQSASVSAYLVAGTPIAINVTATKGATPVTGAVLVNDYNKLTLQATSSAGANASYAWTCVACPASFTLSPNASQSSTLVLNPSSTAGYWTPLATYQFRVDVTPADASSASFSSIVVNVNTPPTAPLTEAFAIIGPSGMRGASTSGYANGVDQWTLTVAQAASGQSGWTGTGTLSYQFYFIDATGVRNFLTSATTALAVTTALPLGWAAPNGSLPVGVVVYDSNGGQTSVSTSSLNLTAPQINLQPGVSASQLLGNLLNSSANLSPSAFLGAVISLASAATAIGGGNSSSVNATAALAQRVQLLGLIGANLASVSPALGAQAVGSVVLGGAVTDPAALSQAANLLGSLLTNALSDPSFSSTPAQLSSFFQVISGLMASNQGSAASTPSRRLLAVTSDAARIATQDSATAVFAQALRADSSSFLGSLAAPASQIVPPSTAAPGVYRAGVSQGVVDPFTVTLTNVTATLTAGATWMQTNPITADTTAYDVQVGLVSPDPYVGLLVNTTNTTVYAGYTVYFDVVDVVNGSSQAAFRWSNATGAPALTFTANNSAAISALPRPVAYQCVEWSDADGYDAIPTTGPDANGALTCYPSRPGSWVSYSATQQQLSTIVPASSSTGGTFGAYGFLFSGYNGSHNVAGYYFWMAVSIALCLLFPAFVLTYRPTQSYPQSTKAAAAGPADVEAQPAVVPGGQEQGVYVSGGDGPINRSARTSTVDAGTLDFVDVNKLKSNVYQQEEKKQENDHSDGSEAPAQNDDVGFIVHQ